MLYIIWFLSRQNGSYYFIDYPVEVNSDEENDIVAKIRQEITQQTKSRAEDSHNLYEYSLYTTNMMQ